MNNKKSIMSLEYIVTLVILGIVLILVLAAFLGPKIGLFNYFSKFVSSARSLLPGKETIQVGELPSSEKFDKFFDKFRITLAAAVGPYEKCLVKYEKIDDFEEFSVVLDNIGKDLFLRKLSESGQIPVQVEIKNINFCRIKPEAFFNNYLKGESCEKDACETDFINQTSITFTADEFNEEFGLQDGGFMYKPENDKVCFIPTHKTGVTWYKSIWQVFTNWGCDASKTALDNDCIKNIEKNIKLCSTLMATV